MLDVTEAVRDEGPPAEQDLRRYYAVLGQRIRGARDAAGITQEELGVALGLSRASIANLEAGRQRVPVHSMARAAERLGVELSSLLPPPASETAGGEFRGLRGAPEEHVNLVRRLLSAVPEEGKRHA